MQALLIYILIRLDEGETEYNNFDYVLIAAVAVCAIFLIRYPSTIDIDKLTWGQRIAEQITCDDNACTAGSEVGHYGLSISWKDWGFEESRRRLALSLIDMYIYADTIKGYLSSIESCLCSSTSSPPVVVIFQLH